MSYFKCKDCKYFLEGGGDGIIYRNRCAVRKYHSEYDLYCQDDVIGIGSPCEQFESREYTCSQCSSYRESGRCTASGYIFGLIGGEKRQKDGPACRFFSPADGCFLTSACVEYMKKSDDCEELTALRKFRDTYMKSVKDGQKLIDEYYETAPKIVEKINASKHKNEYYDYIYSVIKKCVELIEQGKEEETFIEYQTMVLKLKSELL